MKIHLACFCAGVFLLPLAPATPGKPETPKPPENAPAGKIALDLSGIDAEGLRGPPDGKVAVDYEFCIPDTPENRATVKAVDPSVRFMAGSRGRIGCGAGQCLCIGNTHQPGWRKAIEGVAALPFVERIQECFWE